MRVMLREMAGREGVVQLHRASEAPFGEPRLHRHDELEFNLAVRGRAEVLLADRRYRLGPDGLVWLFPGQEHMLVEQSADFTMWVAVFAPGFVRDGVRGSERVLLEYDPPGVFHRRIETPQRRWLERLCRELTDHELPKHHRHAGLADLLLTAWRWFEAAVVVADQARLDEAVAASVRLLERGDDEGDLAALAARVGVSRSWLSRRFAAQVGMSLVEFRARQRLRRFFDLFEQDPRVELTTLAIAAGFPGYAQFHRVFRRFMGRAPREWRSEGGVVT